MTNRPPIARVLDKIRVDTDTECWVFTGSMTMPAGGYGQIKVGGRMRVAHRVTYEYYVGPIPAGMEVDHLCRNRLCVNPDHLEPVTAAENVTRARRRAALVREVNA